MERGGEAAIVGQADDVLDLVLVFFFKQKTAYEVLSGDWSSDVCSSDLMRLRAVAPTAGASPATPAGRGARPPQSAPPRGASSPNAPTRATARPRHGGRATAGPPRSAGRATRAGRAAA